MITFEQLHTRLQVLYVIMFVVFRGMSRYYGLFILISNTLVTVDHSRENASTLYIVLHFKSCLENNWGKKGNQQLCDSMEYSI